MESPIDNDSDPGLGGRMIRTFTAPRENFASIRADTTWYDWFAPTLVVAVTSNMAGMVLMESGSEPVYGEMTEERRAAMESMLASWQDIGFMVILMFSFLQLFAVGGVLLLLANSILGGEASYTQMLAVNAYASLVTEVGKIVTVSVKLATGSMVSIGPGLLMPQEMLTTFAGQVLAGLNIFSIWEILLMAVGTGVMAGCSTLRALIPVLILWGLWVLVAGFTGLALGR